MIHAESLYEFGGLSGVRDQELLASTLDRPRDLLAHAPRSSIFRLAAALCFAPARNRSFNDGNKRITLLATRAFLFLNGHALEPPQDDQVSALGAAAESSRGDDALESWLERNVTALRRPR